MWSEGLIDALQQVVMSEADGTQLSWFFNRVVMDKAIDEMGFLLFRDTMDKLRRQWNER